MRRVPDIICTFVVPLRGSGQRRGTTCERSAVVSGRLLSLRKFDQRGAQSIEDSAPLLFIPSLDSTLLIIINIYIYQNADSNKSIIFAESNLILVSLMSQLQVQVFLNETAQANGKRVFERIVDINEDVIVDYPQVIKTLRFLYGERVIINFNIKSL